MATLKGQNLRVIVGTTCVAMATNCTITINSNTSEASTKDVLSNASLPEVNSISWSVQVDSLNVLDTSDVLAGILAQVGTTPTPLTLTWDETSATDNQSPLEQPWGRTGQTFITDATFTFNDRENSAKNIQFTGTGPIVDSTLSTVTEETNAGYTKGQFVRLFIADESTPTTVVAAAKSLSLHVSVAMEVATTKDTTGDFDVQSPTTLSYDITTEALVRGNDTITSSVNSMALDSFTQWIEEKDSRPYWQIANVSGANNRTKGTVIASGRCIVSQLTINAANRENATYSAQLTGYGPYVAV
jgi:hypothetical protein